MMEPYTQDYDNKKQIAIDMMNEGYYTKAEMSNKTGLTVLQVQSIIFNIKHHAVIDVKYNQRLNSRIGFYHITNMIMKKSHISKVSIDELPKELHKNKLIDWYIDNNKNNHMNVKELYKLAKMHGISVYTCLNGKKKFVS